MGVTRIYYRNGGGLNRTHNQVERTPRLDSFTIEPSTGWSTAFAEREHGLPTTLDCCRFTEYIGMAEKELLELWYHNGRTKAIELSQKRNNYGGAQCFFVCPACGQRVRYLYLTGAGFSCRRCSRLNYRSSQSTKTDSMFFYNKGMELASRHLHLDRRHQPDAFIFSEWEPDRPRGMHFTTFTKYRQRLQKYQTQHAERELLELAKILQIFERK